MFLIRSSLIPKIKDNLSFHVQNICMEENSTPSGYLNHMLGYTNAKFLDFSSKLK